MLKTKNKSTLMMNVITFISLGILILLCMYPDTSLAGATLEGQMDKVGTLANGKLKVVGISTATIIGGIASIIKGNWVLTILIVSIGVTLSLYLEWVNNGLKFAV